MKDLKLLVWLTQLGFSVGFPLAGFVLLGSWLHRSCNWGSWTVWVGILLGILGAADGLRTSLKAMELMSKDPKTKKDEPPVSFNDHN